MDMEHTDQLEDVLRRLPPRALAASRSVCKAWRATVDRLRLLRADLLPLSVDAVIYGVHYLAAPKLFPRRYLAARPDDGNIAGRMRGYCNGLVLNLDNRVVNPATRQWASFPKLPCACVFPKMRCRRCYHSNRYLVYDPTVSPHYQVFFIPRIPQDASDALPYVIYVFSSEINCWKERSFVRDGDAADNVIACWKVDELMSYSAYWKGSLYVPSRRRKYGFVLRLNLSNDKYQVIKLPEGGIIGSLFRIGKSKKGVYYVLNIDGRSTFQIWFLSESHGVMDWVLNNEISFETVWDAFEWDSDDENNEALSKDGFEWDSDDENVVTTVDWPKKGNHDAPTHFFWCLGFHPYKEIALFHDDYTRATFAYYFNSSQIRYLGVMKNVYSEVEISFAYTPCWTMDLPGSN